jgi:hypothetical protein
MHLCEAVGARRIPAMSLDELPHRQEAVRPHRA